MKAHVLSGIDRIDTVAHLLEGKRVGLMTNPTGIDHNFNSSIDVIAKRFNLTALYAVEHGIRGDIQAGEHVENCVDEATGVMVYSAYGKNSHFNEEMLDAFDVLVFDIQDVGARFYTYMYSMAYALEACNRAGKAMIVLDRINPLGGEKTCGTIHNRRFASFVGDYEIPTQHGLTIGEMALYVKDFLKLDRVELTVVPVEGWKRSMRLDETDLPWVAPSPNGATLDAATAYIGTCVFEGTNVSEGRGTTLPFQVIGAPFLDGPKLAERANAHKLPGVHFRPTSFCPTFSKHQGAMCHGVQVHVTDVEAVNMFEAGLVLLDEVRALGGDKFEFLYYGIEVEGEMVNSYFLDKLLGTDDYRLGKKTTQELIAAHKPGVEAFKEASGKYRLYD
ncbi:MAG: DUF1343 domain-containing protein [Clostridia bacterium]|nr:DUF1343 domain-containing protein [Clostridia bacterium]